MIQVNDLIRVVSGYQCVGEVGIVRAATRYCVTVSIRDYRGVFNLNDVEKVEDVATLDEAKEALRLYRRNTRVGRLARLAVYLLGERTSETQAATFSQRDAIPLVPPPAKT